MKARLLPEAEDELDEAAFQYETERRGRGTRFLDRVDAALELIEGHPAIGRIWEETATTEPVRRVPVQRFPYGLIYIEEDLLVVAVAHDRQEPGYWRARLP